MYEFYPLSTLLRGFMVSYSRHSGHFVPQTAVGTQKNKPGPGEWARLFVLGAGRQNETPTRTPKLLRRLTE